MLQQVVFHLRHIHFLLMNVEMFVHIIWETPKMLSINSYKILRVYIYNNVKTASSMVSCYDPKFLGAKIAK